MKKDEEGELHEAYKQKAKEGILGELEDLNQRIRSLFPGRKATLQVEEDTALLKAFLKSRELPRLWAATKMRKLKELKRAGFSEEDALKLID